MIARQKQPKPGTVRPLSGNRLCLSGFKEVAESGIKLQKASQKRCVDVLKAPPASKPNVLDDKSLRRLAYLSHAVRLHRTGGRQALSPVKRTPGLQL